MITKGNTNAPVIEKVVCQGCFTHITITLDTPGDRVYLDDILKEMGWKKGQATGNRYCPDCAPVTRR